MCDQEQSHFTLWKLGRQPVEVTFEEGPIISDAGLLSIRALDRSLGILDDLAARLPDPRDPLFVRHSTQRLLIQQVYQLLAGYPDCNDADELRSDALFQILADVPPEGEEPLASGSTLARFQYAYTRRGQRDGEPEILLVRRAAQLQRIKVVKDFLVDRFIRTCLTPPAEIVLDIDPSDDPTHGKQALSGYHGYYRQHQYFPLFVFDGPSGFPLACWLRHGTAHASLGAVDILRAVVRKLRAVWPNVVIKVRADSGLAVPAVFDWCDQEHLDYAIGYATNPVLERGVATATADVETYYRCYGSRDLFGPLATRVLEGIAGSECFGEQFGQVGKGPIQRGAERRRISHHVVVGISAERQATSRTPTRPFCLRLGHDPPPSRTVSSLVDQVPPFLRVICSIVHGLAPQNPLRPVFSSVNWGMTM